MVCQIPQCVGLVFLVELGPKPTCAFQDAFFDLEVLFKGHYTYIYTWLTVIFLTIGGMILGPIVQKYAFDAYWTGWPFGNDLTDNKSLLAFIFWLVALGYQIWSREKKILAVVAAVVLLAVYMIPHSVLGSEIDYTKEGQQTETQE